MKTIELLVESCRRGIDELPAAGEQTLEEIRDALRALSRSITADGTIDWVEYSTHRELSFLPSRRQNLDIRRLLVVFPRVANVAVESRHGPRVGLVFRDHLLRNKLDATSIRSLAETMSRSRQGILMFKEKATDMLRGAILDDDYTGCRFRFRTGFVAPFRRLQKALKPVADQALSYTQWSQLLNRTWGIGANELSDVEDLILLLFGRKAIRFTEERFETIIIPEQKSIQVFRTAIKTARNLLKVQFPGGLAPNELFDKLGKQVGYGLTPKELTLIVQSIRDVEVTPSGSLRFRLAGLYRMSDQLALILGDHGEPMHARDLADRITAFKGRRGSRREAINVRQTLSQDGRFKPIGKSGVWGLSEWGFETGTIAEIAFRALRQSKGPLTEAELHSFIIKRRPASIGSMANLLKNDGRFQRIAPLTWSLKGAALDAHLV